MHGNGDKLEKRGKKTKKSKSGAEPGMRTEGQAGSGVWLFH